MNRSCKTTCWFDLGTSRESTPSTFPAWRRGIWRHTSPLGTPCSSLAQFRPGTSLKDIPYTCCQPHKSMCQSDTHFAPHWPDRGVYPGSLHGCVRTFFAARHILGIASSSHPPRPRNVRTRYPGNSGTQVGKAAPPEAPGQVHGPLCLAQSWPV